MNMDAVRTVVDFALAAGSRVSGAGRMDVMRASEYRDRGAAVFDEAPDHGLQDPAVRDAWVDWSWWHVVVDPSVDRG